MNSEIEKLIDLAIADGQITEKERNVILKKATELGVDNDEVEMILDGRLHQMDANKPKLKEKVGNIKTCPACGASVKTMEAVCSLCDHEFSNLRTNSELLKLLVEIEKVNIDNYEDEDDYYKKIATLIKRSVVPSSANDLYEFGVKSVAEINSQLNYWREDSTAWKNKAEDCIIKLKMLESQNEKYLTLRIELEKSLQGKINQIRKNDRNDWLIMIYILAVLGVVFLFYKYIIK
jgi:uncharacterized tellurite resistance protein B-like protein